MMRQLQFFWRWQARLHQFLQNSHIVIRIELPIHTSTRKFRGGLQNDRQQVYVCSETFRQLHIYKLVLDFRLSTAGFLRSTKPNLVLKISSVCQRYYLCCFLGQTLIGQHHRLIEIHTYRLSYKNKVPCLDSVVDMEVVRDHLPQFICEFI